MEELKVCNGCKSQKGGKEIVTAIAKVKAVCINPGNCKSASKKTRTVAR